MDDLKEEALNKAKSFHDKIEGNEGLCERLMETDEWHEFREVMIRLSFR